MWGNVGQLAQAGGGSREDEATQPATHSQIGAMWGADAFQADTQPRGQCRLSSACLPGTQEVEAILAGLNDSSLSTASYGPCDFDTQEVEPNSLLDTAAPGRIQKKNMRAAPPDPPEGDLPFGLP